MYPILEAFGIMYKVQNSVESMKQFFAVYFMVFVPCSVGCSGLMQMG